MRRDDWETPQPLFNYLNDKFNFQLDAAATAANSKCVNYFDQEIDALKQSWRLKNGAVFCNPPYSLAREFTRYAITQLHQTPICLLLPVRSDRLWFQEVMHMPETKVCWITGRVHFGGSSGGAFMYNVIFYWAPRIFLPNHIQAGQFNTSGKGDAKS